MKNLQKVKLKNKEQTQWINSLIAIAELFTFFQNREKFAKSEIKTRLNGSVTGLPV